jgi:AcrR family transcriptional regulator
VPRTRDPEAHSVRRDSFVEAAHRLLQEQGYEQMSIQDVLDLTEASRGAFYHYFNSKQELLEAVVDRMVDAAFAEVAPVVDDPHLSAPAKLERFFSGIARYKSEHKELVLKLLQVWLSDDNAIVREKLRHMGMRRLPPLLAPIIRQGNEEGVFDATSPEATAAIVVTLLQGFQDAATEMYVARQANAIGYDAVERAVASETEALERVLGATPGSLNVIDPRIIREWFG